MTPWRVWSWFLGVVGAAVVTTLVTTAMDAATGGMRDKYFHANHPLVMIAAAGDKSVIPCVPVIHD